MKTNKTIVITGCSRGLGRALVSAFVAAGHTVAGSSRSEEAVRELADLYGAPHQFSVVELGDEADVNRWADDVIAAVGTPDLIINNAASINDPMPLWQVPAAQFERLMDINVNAVHRVIRAFVPAMIETGSGILVNISSGWGRSVSADVAPYCASKWAIEGLTKALAEELPPGLAAIALSPGVIDTDMLRQVWGESAGGFHTPEAWAEKAAPYILSINERHNGQSLTTPG